MRKTITVDGIKYIEAIDAETDDKTLATFAFGTKAKKLDSMDSLLEECKECLIGGRCLITDDVCHIEYFGEDIFDKMGNCKIRKAIADNLPFYIKECGKLFEGKK